MKFSAIFVATFAAFAVAAPTPNAHQKRVAVLGTKNYNDITVAGGTAGNAKAEVDALFSALNLNDPANIDQSDINFLNQVNQVGNDAEKLFNTQIAAASGAAATALQNGKIKNKVFKLTGTVLKLQIQGAQGNGDAEKLAAEQKKLNNNIALDKAAAGQPSTAVSLNKEIGV